MSDRDALREQIVSVSVELATELGEEGVTMRGIARRLGISATAIYQHFEGKAAIMEAVRIRGLHLILADVLAAFAIDDHRSCLLEMSRRYITFARSSPWLYAVLMQTGEPLSRAVIGDQTEPLAQIRQQIRNRVSEKFGPLLAGSNARLDRLLGRWWCGLHGMASLAIGGRLAQDHPIVPVPDLDAFAEDYIAALVDGIMAELDLGRVAAAVAATVVV